METQNAVAATAAKSSVRKLYRQDQWEAAVQRARASAPRFAALSPAARAQLLRACMPLLRAKKHEWVRACCEAKGIEYGTPVSGEEWLGGPGVVMRNLRLYAESLERFAAGGLPHDVLPYKANKDGTAEITVFPTSTYDKTLFAGFSCTVKVLQQTVQSGPLPSPKAGKTCLVLGAGNVSSIPAMDALAKMFIEGRTVVLKMNPVNEYLGPIIVAAFEPLVSAGYLSVVYGGADAGEFLCRHAGIDEIHITGSDATHDLIVWGPPGPERERRKANNEPVCTKPITSELGNVSPVVISPGEYKKAELQFMAKNVAAMVANNASCNCNAAKMLVTCESWPQRREFLAMVYRQLANTPARVAYYPGADQRYRGLLQPKGEGNVTYVGTGPKGSHPWALVAGLDPLSDDPLFTTEPFCAILSEVPLKAGDAAEFLRKATAFCNDKLFGTLNVSVMIDPRTEATKEGAAALQYAIDYLDYGTVAINHWPALGYGFVSPPWGGSPNATLRDVGSGIGWVHNTYMLRGIIKSVIRGPLVVSPKPAWFADNKKAHVIGEKLVDFEADPSPAKLPGIIFAALRG